MHLMLNSLDDPISTGETFPERKPAVSPSLSGITSQFISLMVSFMQIQSISWPSNQLGSFCQVPLQPQAWGASSAPSTGHPTPQAVLGRGLLQGKAKEGGVPCSRHFHQSKQTSFSIPWGVCVKEVTLISSCSKNERAPTEHVHISASASWPQGFGCIYWDPMSVLVTKVQLPETLTVTASTEGATAPTQQPWKNELAEWILAFVPSSKHRRLGG